MSSYRVRAVVTVEVSVSVVAGDDDRAENVGAEMIAEWAEVISSPRRDGITALATPDDITITEIEEST